MKEPGEPMFTLTAMDKHGVEYNGKVRRLMPQECFRLQGFTDEQFFKLDCCNLPDSQLYKMAGNSVTTNVVTAIAYRIATLNKYYNIVK
jgi:DNA (cytosine-5)-methyltransferase 1